MAVHDQNPAHGDALDVTRGRALGLAGHAAFETYSVLTRLPGSARVSPGAAAAIIARAFPATVPLPVPAARSAVALFADAGIAGGSVYDGLVGLAAREAGLPLLTCDRRALGTYAALGVQIRLI